MSNVPIVTQLSNTSILFDATQIAPENPLSIQKKIWALNELCQKSTEFIDLVIAMNSITLYLKNSDATVHWLNKLPHLWEEVDEHHFKGRHHKVVTHYGDEHGPDLAYIAKYHNLTERQVIEIHSQVIYQVLFLGFQPGFAYLHGLDQQLHTPRRDEPRTHVAKGSVAIGASQTAIYPADSPGGWHIIGHTNFDLFNPNNKVPCSLLPGDTLQFVNEGKIA